MKTLFSLVVGLGLCLLPLIVQAGTVKVSYTPPTNADWETVVLVSETSGDFTECYGQRSDPGAESVEIGNIRASTEYFFAAYRLIPGTWEKSPLSPEMAFTTPERLPPTVYSLPPIPVGNVIVDITATVIEP